MTDNNTTSAMPESMSISSKRRTRKAKKADVKSNEGGQRKGSKSDYGEDANNMVIPYHSTGTGVGLQIPFHESGTAKISRPDLEDSLGKGIKQF